MVLLKTGAGTDIRDSLTSSFQDVIECPVSSGNWYVVLSVMDVGRGFTNGYRLAVVKKVQTATPMA
jgi:hypothetical protein